MTAVTDTRRAGGPDDAVGGVVPREVVRPTTVDQVAEVLRTAAADGRTVVPVGGRSKLTWAAPPESCDLLLDLTGLDRVVEHVAGDLTVVAEAGVRLADLQAQVGRAGQLLGLDPPEEGATLGGVVSANASGPRRLRYGTTRDLLIGIAVVLADGTVAHAGGKVVKNVAGYDLGKLFTGAHGTLGVVVSTTWRLHPVRRRAGWSRSSCRTPRLPAPCRSRWPARRSPPRPWS
jgi:glycolate oxidase FAD binding subunit